MATEQDTPSEVPNPRQALIEEVNTFKPGTRARALAYLRYGVLNGDAHPSVQARLDRFVGRIEKFGPRAREKVLRALGEGA